MLPNLGVRLIADRETRPYTPPVLKRLGAIIGQDAPSAHPFLTRLRKLATKMRIVRDEETKVDVREDDQLASWVRAIG